MSASQSQCLWVPRVGGILASQLPSQQARGCQSLLLSGMWQSTSLPLRPLQDFLLILSSSAYMGSGTRLPPPHPRPGAPHLLGDTLHTGAPPPAAHITTKHNTHGALLPSLATSVVTLPSSPSQWNYSNTISLVSTQCTNTLFTITKSFIILH